MRVVLAGTYDADLNRNRRLKALLEAAGHDVASCRVELWGKTRYDIMGDRKLEVLRQGIVAYPRLAWRFIRAPRADAAFVLFPGWFDMLVLVPLARLRGMPVIFDPLISLYDTAVIDRKVARERTPMAWISKMADRLSMRLATRVLADTPDHADFYSGLTGVPRDRVGVVWLGAQDDLFSPRPGATAVPDRVLFHGTFIALQGIGTILRAAKLLEPDGIRVRVVGSGQEQPLVDSLIRELRPTNVDLLGVIPADRVADEIAAASLCLGIFGTSDKSRRVVPNKVFECVAVGRPVITADTKTMRQAFTHDEVALVPAGNPEALADKIRRLLADPALCARMGAAARAHYEQAYATGPLSELLDEQLRLAVRRPA
jgi:glycosyltransferase involved in cell wall biosynthesis